MVFIYINSRLLQVMDASRERRENESSWFCRNVCCTVPVGPGPLCFHPFPPGASVRHPQLSPLKTACAPVSTSALAQGGDWPLNLTKAAMWQLGLSTTLS